MRVALLQLNSQNDTGHNLQSVDIFLADAARQKAQYALLPENFAFFGSEQEKKARGKDIYESTSEFLSAAAKKYHMVISGGGFPQQAPSAKFYNSAITFNSDGTQLHRYDKLHLFDATPGDNVTYQESRNTESGEKNLSLFEIPPFKFGMSVCYDLRFPSLYRILARMGANVLCMPAAFTRLTGTVHWHTLLKARAIENTCYVLAAAQTGTHFDGRETFGHSLVVDPWGEIIVEANERPGVIVAEISAERISEVRARMPSLSHDKV